MADKPRGDFCQRQVEMSGSDLESELRRDSDVALVEEAMELGPDEKPVGDLMRAR
jgi:hypothetical protein